MSAISATGLVKRYGDRIAVDGVSLTVESGQIYALLGDNGAGKTTTLHLLLGLVRPDAGGVFVAGRAAFLPEVVDLYPDLDPLETLDLFMRVARVVRSADECRGALLAAGLPAEAHRQRIGTFSKGMRQKVALAAAELQGARALLLDEPTSGLDPRAREQLMKRLIELRRGGAAILLSTHDVLHVEAVADRFGFMVRGRLVLERERAALEGTSLLELYRDLER